VNGHFSLDHEARRNLWIDDKEGYRSAWNKHLMSDVATPPLGSKPISSFVYAFRTFSGKLHFPENPIRRTINHFECSPQLFLTVKV
jgi:hypothetical protein